MSRPRPIGSIYDVARESGVSIGTVSRVFNDKPDVAAATRELVLEAAKRVRYMPRISTRRISVGLMVEQIEKANQVGFVSDTVSTLAKHMALRGAILELIPANDLNAVYRNYLRGLLAILFGPVYERLRSIRHIPIVLINNFCEGPNFHTVASDHAQGARVAAEHLLKRGHRRIAFLEVEPANWGAMERERGFREAFKAARGTVPEDLIGYCGESPARDTLEPLLARHPTALLVCGEDLSLEVNRILIHELRLNIPKDLSVVTYETPLVSALLSPPQTAVVQPWEDVGRGAVDTVLSLIRGTPRKRVKILVPNLLIERASVRDLREKGR